MGLDITRESLREGWRERCATLDETWKGAKACRAGNVVRPSGKPVACAPRELTPSRLRPPVPLPFWPNSVATGSKPSSTVI